MPIKRLIPKPSFAACCVIAACTATLPAQTFTVLHIFQGTDGAEPSNAALTLDSAGDLYGTTMFGGSTGLGTAYKITAKNHSETVLHSFTGPSDGENPSTGLVLGSDGNLYGGTIGGGANNFGTAFRITPAGTFSNFYDFSGAAQASAPQQILAGTGALYGVGGGGAPFYGGVAFRLDASGETDFYTAAGGADGNNMNWMVRDLSGNFYGTAGSGGDLACGAPSGCGVIYKIDTKGAYSVLHIFIGPDGAGPRGLTLDSAGNLYGTTASGGTLNAGTVFELSSSGQFRTLYSFTGGADGENPQSAVVRDAYGNLYGTTSQGGTTSSQSSGIACGVVFMLSPTTAGAWRETVLHSFNGSDGCNPQAPLLLDPSQPALYGTTNRGGDFSCSTINAASSCGVVFKISR